MAIVNTANRPWAVIDSDILLGRWPGVVAQEIYFSPGGRPFDNTGLEIDKAVTLLITEQQLIVELEALCPDVIYLRVSPHTKSEFLISKLRDLFPSVILITEFYDASCHFDVKALNYIFSGNSRSVAAALDGCRTGFNEADGAVVKMGGMSFVLWCENVTRMPLTFFPSLVRAEPAVKANSFPQRRVLYAGSLSSRELVNGIGSIDGANFIRYFDSFLGRTDCTLDIVNAAHAVSDDDSSEKFARLLEQYGPTSGQSVIRYRKAMHRQELIKFAAGFDIGICCAHYAEDLVMEVTRYGLPNRMMSYLAAGLPVVIDNRFEYAADLISKFDAGAVVSAGDFEGFMDALVGLDLERAAAGVQKLIDFMCAENEEVLVALDRLIGAEIPFLKTEIE